MMKEPLDRLSLAGLVQHSTESSPESVALLTSHQKPISYADLLQDINAINESLAARGIRRHDPVAVVLPNGPDLAAGILGVALAAACAPLNPAYRSSEFESLFADLRPQLVLVGSSETCAAEVARSCSIPVVEFSRLRREADQNEIDNRKLVSRGGGDPPEPDDIALLLFTSGTTARPKLVSLTHRNLTASALNVVASLQLTSADRCLNPMPLFHIHGLVAGLLAPLAAGSSVVCTSRFDPEEFVHLLGELHPTWFTAVPTMHQALVRCAQVNAKRFAASSLRFIRSCSAPLARKLMSELEEVFGAPVIQAYGMTEAAHQITCNPLPPKARKPGSVGVPSGTEVAIVDPQGTPVSSGEIGEVIIRSPGLTSGYANNPKATRDRFSCGWLRTGDRGFLDGEGYLFLTGRLDEVINRGGEKISPAEVDEVLQEHPAVKEAVTFAVSHPTLGQDSAAAVVLHDGISITPVDIQRFASTRLVDFKIPRHVVIVNAIPKTASGKLDRRTIAKQFAFRSGNPETSGAAELPLSGLTPKESFNRETRPGAPDTPKLAQRFVAARTAAEQDLIDIWKDVLNLESVGIYDNFFDLGGHSLMATVVVARIKKIFDVELPLSAFFEAQTIAELATMIAAIEPACAGLPKIEEIINQVETLSQQDAERLLVKTN